MDRVAIDMDKWDERGRMMARLDGERMEKGWVKGGKDRGWDHERPASDTGARRCGEERRIGGLSLSLYPWSTLPLLASGYQVAGKWLASGLQDWRRRPPPQSLGTTTFVTTPSSSSTLGKSSPTVESESVASEQLPRLDISTSRYNKRMFANFGQNSILPYILYVYMFMDQTTNCRNWVNN